MVERLVEERDEFECTIECLRVGCRAEYREWTERLAELGGPPVVVNSVTVDLAEMESWVERKGKTYWCSRVHYQRDWRYEAKQPLTTKLKEKAAELAKYWQNQSCQ